MPVSVENVICPKCGDHVYQNKYIDKKLYVCAHPLPGVKLPNGKELKVACFHAQSYCPKCEKIYDQSNFGKNGDVYECKTCGTVNWAYTDFRNEQDGIKADISKANKKFNDYMNK